MSILIRGMEMPKSCSECPFPVDDDYFCKYGARREWGDDDDDNWQGRIRIPPKT